MNFALTLFLIARQFSRFKEKSYGSSGATSGLTSSLAFTPVQVSSVLLFNYLLMFHSCQATMRFSKVMHVESDGGVVYSLCFM